MKKHLLSLSLVFSSFAFGEATPWWEQDGGYASTGGFHSNLNGGKAVGTGGPNSQAAMKAYQDALKANSTGANAAAQLKADGTYETEADRLIRLSRLPANAAPNVRNEVVPSAKNPDGTLGLDEKLVDAANLSKVGADGVFAESAQLAFAPVNIQLACGILDKKCYDDEMVKVKEQQAVYSHNITAFGDSRSMYEQGIRKLTRDYHKLEAKGPTGGGQAGALSSKSVTYQDDAKMKDAIAKQIANLPEETLAHFREHNIDAADYAERFMRGEFETADEITAALKLNEPSTTASTFGGGVGSAPESEMAENVSEDRVQADAGNVERGPVLNIKDGSFISFGKKKKNAAGGAAEDDSSGLMNALANFVNGQTNGRKPGRGKGAGQEDEITERDRRDLLNFVVTWWKQGDEAAPVTVPQGVRYRTIFDIAHDSYGEFGGERAARGGPVAYNELNRSYNAILTPP